MSLHLHTPHEAVDPATTKDVERVTDELDLALGARMRRILVARYGAVEAEAFLASLLANTEYGTPERRAQDRAFEMLSSRLIKAAGAA